MNEQAPRLATVGLAALGAGIAAYLSYTRLADTSLICPTTGCATVQRSSYSELAGVPVAYLGVAGYAAIALTGAARGRTARAAATALTAVAAAFAAYLLVAQLALVDAVCVWCLASDLVVLGLVVAAVLRARTARSQS